MIGIIVSNNHSIFISHSSVDNESALLIHKELKQRGFSPWLDTTDIPAGANYARTIMEALESASAFVLLLTQSALKSEHVAREVEVAVSQKIPIFPLNMSGQKDIQPLLTKEWRYWLAIVQVLNAPDTSVAVTSIIEAMSRKGIETGVRTTPSNNNPVTQNKLQLPTALQANKSRNDQAEKLKREQDAKAAKERLEKEAKERDRITQEKAKQELEEQERKKKAELDAKLKAERLERERVEQEARERQEREDRVEAERVKQEARERQEREDRVEAERQSRLQTALPRIEQATRVIDWMDELIDWLYTTVVNESTSGHNFDYSDFKTTFDENFIVDLYDLEDIAEEKIHDIGNETLDIFKMLVSNPYLTQGNPELAKPFLDLSLQYKSAWSLFYAGEWAFARNGVDAGKKHFLSADNQSIFLDRAKRSAKLEANGDELAEIAWYKLHVFEWKWMELLVQLADKKIRPDKLNSIFQEIDKTLTNDSADERSEVYLHPRQRIQWKFLGSYTLYRLERNTAARNFLRGFSTDSDEYKYARGEIWFTQAIARGEALEFTNDLLKVIDSWR